MGRTTVSRATVRLPSAAAEGTRETSLGAAGMRFADARHWARKAQSWFHRSTGVDWRDDPEGVRLRSDHIVLFGTVFSFKSFVQALRQGLRATFFIANRGLTERDVGALLAVAQQEGGYSQTRSTVVVSGQGLSAPWFNWTSHPRWQWLGSRADDALPQDNWGGWYISFLAVFFP